jgi:phosphate transport system substrate-binding protein
MGILRYRLSALEECQQGSVVDMGRASATVAGLAGLAATLAMASPAAARDQIRIVGSSTVFPFASTVVERFGQKTGHPTPVIESTGSGGGLKLFCAGVGEEHPDIANSSRRIKESEVATCAQNGVKEITEVQIGFDGIVLANSKNGPAASFTIPQIWQALAKEVPVDGELKANPYQNWSEIDPSLPDERIEVLGPPPTSGTRDAFVELVMLAGCEEFEAIKALPEDQMEQACATMREDGRFVEAGENDNLIVQKLEANPAAFGIFGFSFLDQNRDKLQGSSIDEVDPSFDNIASGDYPVSRSLYFYVKNAHLGVVPGIEEYVQEFTSEDAMGEFGYLVDKGLIPLPEDQLSKQRQDAQQFKALSLEAS